MKSTPGFHDACQKSDVERVLLFYMSLNSDALEKQKTTEELDIFYCASWLYCAVWVGIISSDGF